MSEKKHAKLSPSGAERWMECPGSVPLSEGLTDPGSKDATAGTARHEVGYMCLTNGTDAYAYVGRYIEVGPAETYEFTDDDAENVQAYVDSIRQFVANSGGTLFVEVEVPIGHLTSEEGATGTADAVILTDDELQVHDYKSGYRRVRAERNKQMMKYALGTYHNFSDLYKFERIRMVIHQPRHGAPDEWDCSVEELLAFGQEVRNAATRVEAAIAVHKIGGPIANYLNPGEAQCQYCRAKATCPALSDFVQRTVGAEFEDLDAPANLEGKHLVPADPEQLAKAYAAVPLIEMFCTAVSAKVEADLLAGAQVPGFKLAQGRKGNRTWGAQAEAVEKLMKESMRIKEADMYTFKLKGPAPIEKLLAKEHPRQWSKLKEFVAQSDGKPTVVPESDPRPAMVVTPVADQFDALPAVSDSLEDIV